MPDRFAEKADGRFVWHWNEAEVRYDPAHVNPTSWPMHISGCQTEADLVAAINGEPTAHTYVFESATGQRIEGRDCQFTARRSCGPGAASSATPGTCSCPR